MPFTQNWFEITGRPLWEAHIKPRFAGKDDLRFLEIGSHEGGSARWICDNVLTGARCEFECVDPFTGSMEHAPDPGLEARFRANLGPEIAAHKVWPHKMTSFDYLIAQHNTPVDIDQVRFDLVYIDGSHVAKDVLMDAMLSWPLLKIGGLLVFDDYAWREYKEPELAPRLGADAFHTVYNKELKVIHASSQVIIEKVPSFLTRTPQG